jgi:tetratricopeptide (TPR) repeat protein
VIEIMKRRILATAAAGIALLGGAAACTGTPGNGATSGSAAQPNEVNLVNQGVSLGMAGRYDAAKAIFEQVLASNPNNKWAWFNLGYIAQLQNDPSTAATDYDKSLAADQNYTPALWNKAILLEKSNVDAAMTLYRRILVIYPNAATTHLRLGLLLDRKGNRTDARAEFDAAVAADAKLRNSVPVSYRHGS